uniref:Tc1-like transposase DDE domain-containing protein n=1 Tax=Oryzias latipes TaxID=8090 RepID=A0A3P9JUB2_ORYLA
ERIIVTARPQEVEVPLMVWPEMTSDLNPIDNVCDQLQQRLDDCTQPPSDLTELHVALVEETPCGKINSALVITAKAKMLGFRVQMYIYKIF